jgi:hypothetical protein
MRTSLTIAANGILFAAILNIGAAEARKPENSGAAQVLAAERARLEAFRAADRVALSGILSDDATVVHSNGELSGKADELDAVRPGTPEAPLPTLELVDPLVRVHGTTAVITGHLVEREGKTLVLRLSFTNTYYRADGRWRFLAGQLTKVS